MNLFAAGSGFAGWQARRIAWAASTSHEEAEKQARGKRRASNATKRRKRVGDPSQHHNGLRLGLEATIERVVRPEHTLQTIDPNLPAVFSTPSMIGLMEHASVVAVRSELPPGTISVGTESKWIT